MRDEENSLGQKKLRRQPYRRRRWRSYRGFRGMTLRDWLPIVGALLIPVVIAFVGLRFTAQLDARQQRAAEQRAQDLALQAYLDQMNTLVLEELRDPKVQAVMHARTLTALAALDSNRKSGVTGFLVEADLVSGPGESKPIVSLSGADLEGAYMGGADLTGANLHVANLGGADLSGADLEGADLFHALPYDADLSRANLKGAALKFAMLDDDTDLKKADLEGVKGITNEQLHQSGAILDGATMPNGQKYEDWLKSKGRGEDREHTAS